MNIMKWIFFSIYRLINNQIMLGLLSINELKKIVESSPRIICTSTRPWSAQSSGTGVVTINIDYYCCNATASDSFTFHTWNYCKHCARDDIDTYTRKTVMTGMMAMCFGTLSTFFDFFYFLVFCPKSRK